MLYKISDRLKVSKTTILSVFSFNQAGFDYILDTRVVIFEGFFKFIIEFKILDLYNPIRLLKENVKTDFIS